MGRKDTNNRLTDCKVISFEITGDYREAAKEWHELAKDCQGLANSWWQCWNAWHFRNDSFRKICQWLDARQKADDPKDAGKCPVESIPEELRSELHQLRWRFPRIPSRISTLLPQRIVKTMQNRKAAKGNLPGHTAIILGQESFPVHTQPYPILFDRVNASFEPPVKRGGNWHMHINIVRTEDADGKGSEDRQRLELWCKGKKVRSQVVLLERIAAGVTARQKAEAEIAQKYELLLANVQRGSAQDKELRKAKSKEMAEAKKRVRQTHHVFCGSQLVYSRSKRKWFAKICYEAPLETPPNLDASKVAVLRAHVNRPWELELPGGVMRMPGGHGRYIAPVRRQLLMQRWNRRANYRNAGSANKGHGRERAGAGPQWKLQQQWKNFVKRVNSGVVREVLDACVANGCGSLVYEQPDGDFRDTRFLATAGKVEGRRDSSAWDWFQVRTMLEQRCVDCGIDVTVRKVEGSDGDETAGSPRSDRSDVSDKVSDNGNGKPAGTNGKKTARKRQSSKSKPQKRGTK